MRKRVQAIAVLIALVVSMVGSVFVDNIKVKAASEVTINFHYLRTDGNYADWDVWTWYDGGEGEACAFSTAADANGVTATRNVDAGTKKVGYIVRRGGDSWAEKDPSENDNFVDISSVVGGTVDLYIVSQGDIKEDFSKATVVKGALLSTANGEGKEVELAFTEALSALNATDVVIKDGAGTAVNVSKAELSADKKSATVTLATELDAAKTYTAEYMGLSMKITTPDYFSSSTFEKEFTYDGDDLGANWTKKKTTFKVWAPTADSVSVVTFKSGAATMTDQDKTYEMKKGSKGVWSVDVDGDLNGTYYIYKAVIEGSEVPASDPYAKAVGINGAKSMVIDLASTNPKGWDKDKNITVENITDAILYELHVRDFSSDPNSGIKNAGKYLAFTEKGTKTKDGFSTGIDYLSDLGVNFVHLLPTYDFGSVDETNSEGKYNWGYDPVNYFAVEGSYATDAEDGSVRVNEYKQMVQSLHGSDIGVVTDVVFNHVYQSGSFSYNKLVPGYYCRPASNGSGCGNDVASERVMVRKYIIDCLKYWQSEYHIDGFRFDLMGLLDVETMNDIHEALAKENPNVIIYGEGWYASEPKLTKACKLALKANASMTERIAYFSDDIRDATKGGVFQAKEKGYVSNATGKLGTITLGVQGAPSWAKNPTQVVNYVSAHDNNTLFDKISICSAESSEEDRIKMNCLAAAIVYMSEGIPFTMSGEEGAKTKVTASGDLSANSYNLSDTVNMLNYERADEYNKKYGLYDYYKGLIEFRKNHSALRMTSAEDVKKNVTIENLDTAKDTNVLMYSIKKANDEVADALYIVLNPTTEGVDVKLPSGDWNLCINGEKAGTDVIEKCNGNVTVDPISCYVFVKGETKMSEKDSDKSDVNTKQNMPSTNTLKEKVDNVDEGLLITILAIGAAILAVIGTFVYFSANRKKISQLKSEEDIIGPKSENRLLNSLEEKDNK